MSVSGWKPPSTDDRDYLFSAPEPSSRDSTAHSILIRHPFPPRDQRSVPCCVSITIITCMEALDGRTPPTRALAPLFHYHIARADPTEPALLELRDGFHAATSRGVCRLELHDVPFDDAGADTLPSPEAFENAQEQRIGFDLVFRTFLYEALRHTERVDEWRAALRARLPIAFGFYTTDAYWSLAQGRALHPPATYNPTQEGHAAVVLGFDDNHHGGVFIVKDSRGTQFGRKGHWLLPYDLVNTPLVSEAWVLKRITYD